MNTNLRLPWRYTTAMDRGSHTIIQGIDQFCIATVWSEEFAPFIVDAANNHAALVEVLLEAVAAGCRVNESDGLEPAWCEIARAAIAKAEGKS